MNEKNEDIYGIWDWLINKAQTADILVYRDFSVGEDIRTLPIEKAHRNLIGFCINRGSVAPRNIVQKWSCQVKNRPNWASTPHYTLTKIAEMLPDIKKFRASCGSYLALENQEATWFIDPPYSVGGEHYTENTIDYGELRDWCLSRHGQVIVCENSSASWLPFRPLGVTVGQRKKTIECVWTNE